MWIMKPNKAGLSCLDERNLPGQGVFKMDNVLYLPHFQYTNICDRYLLKEFQYCDAFSAALFDLPIPPSKFP